MGRARVGVVGAGNVVRRYGAYLRSSDVVELAACADASTERAAACAATYGIPRACTPAELLDDPSIAIVLNLTPPRAHVDVTHAALAAGKHVYSEKPLAATWAEGNALAAFARERGLLLACAPDTFLGPSLEQARARLDAGDIGTPVGFTASFVTPGSELWHPDPDFLFSAGGGPIFDEGPYFLTALVSLLGPLRSVTAQATTVRTERTIVVGPRAGERIAVDPDVPMHVAATLTFAAGAVGTLFMTFEVLGSTLPPIEIYGTTGTLRLAFPGFYGGDLRLGRAHDAPWTTLAVPPIGETRGVGVEDLARAIAERRAPRCNASLALHVLDAMESIHRAAATGARVDLRP